MTRVFLSPPDVGDAERAAVDAAIRSGWVAPVGPDLTAFESEVAAVADRTFGVGLSSGTAAIHLALLDLDVGPGDHVVVSTFTFAASANAIAYCGAIPVLIDSESDTWNLSPDLLEEELTTRSRRGIARPKAAVVVDLYGQCADYGRILDICATYDVPVIEDAAESLGASYRGRPAGSFGVASVFSFNGNKIITTSGGGMLTTDQEQTAFRARHLATQARQPAPHYEHTEVGFNYRLSNLLAAVGRAQLAALPTKVARRRAVNARYRSALSEIDGIAFQPVAEDHEPNCWLTCLTIDPDTGCAPEDLRLALEEHDIEARPTWKPMHLQPVFSEAPRLVDGTSDRLFATGLCLPSGSTLSEGDQDRVIEVLLERLRG